MRANFAENHAKRKKYPSHLDQVNTSSAEPLPGPPDPPNLPFQTVKARGCLDGSQAEVGGVEIGGLRLVLATRKDWIEKSEAKGSGPCDRSAAFEKL